MFDAVARGPAAVSGREVFSLTLAIGSTGAALALLWQLGVHTVQQVDADVSPLIYFEPQEPSAPVSRPEPPSKPAPPAEATRTQPSPTPVQAPEQAPVGPEAPGPVAASHSGDPSPVAGEGEGEELGPTGGETPGPAAQAPTPLEPRRRVDPVFPQAARRLGMTDAYCSLQFTVDTRGEPTAIEVLDCPDAFRASALDAAWRWRFYPQRVGGVAQVATFSLNIRYRLR